jgi:hypothetical protein
MLALFEDKLDQEPEETRKRVQVLNGKMSEFSLDKKFNTIICVDAFYHIITVDEQVNCLNCILEHLTPQGRFLFNLPYPNCEFIQKYKASQGKKYKERGRFPLDEGSGSVLIEQAQLCDEQKQQIQTKLRFTTFDSRGNKVKQEESSWIIRYVFKYEAIHLLYRMGFFIEALVGNYKNGLVETGSQLIFKTGRA